MVEGQKPSPGLFAPIKNKKGSRASPVYNALAYVECLGVHEGFPSLAPAEHYLIFHKKAWPEPWHALNTF
jgi:hypothetical protein